MLDESQIQAEPMRQFADWFEQAVAARVDMPEAMVIATITPDGAPAARCVLLKGYDDQGFVFYTHTISAKGRQLAANPRAALVFYWGTMHRQVRVEGSVGRVSDEEADRYFASRPYGSRVSVWVAPQSSVVPGRKFLEDRYAELDTGYHGGDVPRPETWGGYRVSPDTVEFWQGRENRLHDRLRYTRAGNDAWKIERLAP